eukprot:7188639-Prymnesium_polylepis.1
MRALGVEGASMNAKSLDSDSQDKALKVINFMKPKAAGFGGARVAPIDQAPAKPAKPAKKPIPKWKVYCIEGASCITALLLILIAVLLSVDIFTWVPANLTSTIVEVFEDVQEVVEFAADVASDYYLDLTTSPPRPRLAVAMSGGGLRAMTASMAVARGIANADDGWERITHLSSVSGGSWFSSQMVYSGRFYTEVTSKTKPMDQVIREWGDDYARVMRKAIQQGDVRTIDPQLRAMECDTRCIDTRRIMAIVVDLLLQVAEVPLMEWEPWVGTFLIPYIDNVMDGRRYNSTKNGLSSATLIQGLVLPPNAWTPNAPSGGRERAALVVTTANPQDGLDHWNGQWTLPLGY